MFSVLVYRLILFLLFRIYMDIIYRITVLLISHNNIIVFSECLFDGYWLFYYFTYITYSNVYNCRRLYHIPFRCIIIGSDSFESFRWHTKTNWFFILDIVESYETDDVCAADFLLRWISINDVLRNFIKRMRNLALDKIYRFQQAGTSKKTYEFKN